MTRVRLRPAHTPEGLTQLYPTPHDHTQWPDHIERVKATIAMVTAHGTVASAADLSCGSGAVLAATDAACRYYGDIAPGYEMHGPIEQTIEDIPPVDLFVCCETLEHLDDPDSVLKAIRRKARALVLSTPLDAWGDTNIEHYWAWSQDDVERMLADAGFFVNTYTYLDYRASGGYYSFGVWGAR